jgi:hypothetical protein
MSWTDSAKLASRTLFAQMKMNLMLLLVGIFRTLAEQLLREYVYEKTVRLSPIHVLSGSCRNKHASNSTARLSGTDSHYLARS